MPINAGQYKKGISGNLNGRPLAQKDELAKLRKFTNKKSTIAYKQLTKALDEAEPWAIELIIKDLMPKSDLLHLEIDPENSDKIGAMIDAILSALSQREHLTVSESLQLLDCLVHLRKSKQDIHLPNFN